ncbi:BAHD acyltransferase [Selaginella moellendorffii]|uniref:BAHD acyltransferase n=1 Tax=Selaginella moellendorffii TaxID=88036 RepID=D8RXC2_SELML|nr:shikimate O-hydroxycinnamoyltransferase [Selaginella moellendorffii]EFJ23411.1 BAHD acyltransferase [Selaginella moellendorffii]|eukprot:XP_002975782.1 shikimate O-hydroxycinnamoyltransferase [Selaginella moellendorffii]
MKITSRTRYAIKLPAPSPGGIHPLSNIDQIVPRYYTQFLLFFPTTTRELSTDNLKASLSTTLATFYPLAGRYAVLPNNALQLECSDQGSDFFEAFVDGGLDDFGGFEQHDPRFELLSPTGIYKTSGDITEAPLVTAQVTRFQCGGSSLVLGVHHNVGDGFSASSFLTAWSLVSRGEGEEFLAPCFDHSLMDAKTLRKVDDPAKLFNHVEYQTQRPNVPATFPELKACMFKFPTWAIEALRSFCEPGTTKFEALAAHVWKSVTKARNLESHEETKLGMAVDGRTRFTPPLPEKYFGNVIFYACTSSSSQKLVENPVRYSASLVHEATHLITDEYMRSALHWLEQQPSPLGVFPSFCDARTDLALTSWSRFPLYDVDFGGGKPVFVGLPVAAFTGLVIFLPWLDDQTMVVLVGLYAEHMRNLLADPEFCT